MSILPVSIYRAFFFILFIITQIQWYVNTFLEFLENFYIYYIAWEIAFPFSGTEMRFGIDQAVQIWYNEVRTICRM